MARSIALVALLLAAGIAVASAQAPISTFVNLSPSVLPASPMAGDTIVVMGNLTYGDASQGPVTDRVITCKDQNAVNVSGAVQVVGTLTFNVGLAGVVTGSPRFIQCSVDALTVGTTTYTSGSETIAIIVSSNGTLAPMPPPRMLSPPKAAFPGNVNVDNVTDNTQPPTGFGGIPGLQWNGFIVVPAVGDFAGTQEDGTKVLTNAQGTIASLVAPQTFDILGFYFYIANPNAGTGLSVTITCTPSGVSQNVTLLPNQGPTLVMPFFGCTQLLFTPMATPGRKLRLASVAALPTSFALDNVALAVSATVPPPPTAAATAPPPAAGTPPATPTAAPPAAGMPPPAKTPTPPPAAATAVPPPAATPTMSAPTPATLPTFAPTKVAPPPGTPTAAPTTGPTAAPAGTPTAAPTKAPTKAPTRAPTKAPTRAPTKAPTRAPTKSPTRCTAEGESSLFKQFSTQNTVCYPPMTLSARSTTCTNAVLPAFILSNANKKATVRCINPQKPLVTLLLPTKSSKYSFLNKYSYVGASLRLDGTIPREGNGNGSQVFQGFNHRLRFRFVDTDRLLLKKWGQTVQLTGTIRRPGPLLDYCFVSYLKVCPV